MDVDCEEEAERGGEELNVMSVPGVCGTVNEVAEDNGKASIKSS